MTLEYTTGKYKDKKLCEVVVSGTQDSAMNEGGEKYKTQTLNIYEQAKEGVRIFDVRIRVHAKTKKLTGFHGGSFGREYGMTLEKILNDAVRFVHNTSEFVKIKFDHCENWNLIADAIKEEIPIRFRSMHR